MKENVQANPNAPSSDTRASGTEKEDPTTGDLPDTGLPADQGGTQTTPRESSMLGGASPVPGYKMNPGGAGDMAGGSEEEQDTTGRTGGPGRFGTG